MGTLKLGAKNGAVVSLTADDNTEESSVLVLPRLPGTLATIEDIGLIGDLDTEQLLEQMRQIEENTQNIIELEEEIEALAPSLDRGAWAYDADAVFESAPALGSFYIATTEDSVSLFAMAENVLLSREDEDEAGHSFDGIEVGQHIEIFDHDTANFLLGDITEVTLTETHIKIGVRVEKSLGGPTGSIRLKVFTLDSDISLDAYAQTVYVDNELAKKADSYYVDNELAKKANTGDVYTKAEMDAEQQVQDANIIANTEAIANLPTHIDAYSKAESDTLLDDKATVGASYTKAESYNATEVTEKLLVKADKVDTYTKTEVDASINGKANTGSSNVFRGQQEFRNSDLLLTTVAPNRFATIKSRSPYTSIDGEGADTSGAFGLAIDLSSGNTYKNTFKVVSNNKDLFTITGGSSGFIKANDTPISTGRTTFENSHLVSKKYVDDNTVLLTGDSTKTGSLTLKTNAGTPFEVQGSNGSPIFKMWSSGAISMEKNYTAFKDSELVNKKYVDGRLAAATATIKELTDRIIKLEADK